MVKLKKMLLRGLINWLRAPEKRKHFTSAVIVAGGRGERVGADIPKQHLKLCDKEIVVHTMLAFEACTKINEIVVVCRSGEENLYHEYKLKYGITKMVAAVPGGETRQESVLNGFEALDDKCEYVAIHDAARCLITSEAISDIIVSAYKYKAATAAKAATDTVKLADDKGFIEKTIDRSRVYLAETPQVFERDMYSVIAYSAKRDGFCATDDNSLAERLGFKVKLCPTGCVNMKITSPEDLSVAEELLKLR